MIIMHMTTSNLSFGTFPSRIIVPFKDGYRFARKILLLQPICDIIPIGEYTKTSGVMVAVPPLHTDCAFHQRLLRASGVREVRACLPCLRMKSIFSRMAGVNELSHAEACMIR